MKLITLASGSKGNCTLLQTNKTKILIDAGIRTQEIEEKLTMLGIAPEQIYGILVTHEHSDHIKSVGVFARRYGCFVFAEEREWPVLDQKIGKLDEIQKIAFRAGTFYIQDITVNAFELPHDCNLCLGYSFYHMGSKISIATDFGHPTKNILDNLRDSNILILEANHDENLLINNPHYSSMLKHRILSRVGHISNRTSAGIIRDIFSTNLKQVILAHLSEENNSPELAYNTIKTELSAYGIIEGKHLYIDVSTQHNMGHMFEISED